MWVIIKRALPATILFLVFLSSCTKETVTDIRGRVRFPESFELGSKADYATGDIIFYSGSWNLNNTVTGNTDADVKTGLQSLRAQDVATITMNFDLPNGASSVSFNYAKYGADANSTLELWASTNGGASWGKVDNAITVSASAFTKASFNVAYFGYVRFQIRKTGSGKVNIDDFNVVDYDVNVISTIPTRDNNLAMGNPSNAVTDVSTADNYLLVKSQYALSYNNSKGGANWVSWHLSSSWKGASIRCDCFLDDLSLPSGFFKAVTFNYSGTGFDRGHLCPSDDRDSSDADNAATFLLTNILPQAPNLNQSSWAALETYSRTLLNSGNELYIIAGGYGSGGTGSNGGVTTTIAGGKINVPAHFWKVIVILKTGANDVTRVNTSTRVIAVDMPNTQAAGSTTWGNYRTSVDAIETATGFDFLSNVPVNIQAALEAQVDNGPTQ